MKIKYSESETHDKAAIVERYAKRFGSLQLYVDDWMQENDPEVNQVRLEMEGEEEGRLEGYLRALQ